MVRDEVIMNLATGLGGVIAVGVSVTMLVTCWISPSANLFQHGLILGFIPIAIVGLGMLVISWVNLRDKC